jgi:sulfur relay (sulfurtransferase) complex TusBCD TusD component (DsrE family)
MKSLKMLLAAFAIAIVGLVGPALAGKDDPLFVNLSSDDMHRSTMAVRFSKAMLERGHSITIFLNDKGVMVASTAKSKDFADQQKELADLMEKGVTVIACQHCMHHHGVKDNEMLKGVKLGTPEMTGDALFKDNTKTMTW